MILPPGDSWQCVETLGGDVTGEMGFLVSGGWRPEILLITLQCIGRLTSKSGPAPDVGSAPSIHRIYLRIHLSIYSNDWQPD